MIELEVLIGGGIIVGVILLGTYMVSGLSKLPPMPPKTAEERRKEEEIVVITLSGM
jgi:hypothetical protein